MDKQFFLSKGSCLAIVLLFVAAGCVNKQSCSGCAPSECTLRVNKITDKDCYYQDYYSPDGL